MSFDDSGFRVKYLDEESCRVEWDLIERVSVETNDSGPWGADFWYLFEYGEERFGFPLGATGAGDFIELARVRFPGFDFNTWGQAIGSTRNARFVCWERDSNKPADE